MMPILRNHPARFGAALALLISLDLFADTDFVKNPKLDDLSLDQLVNLPVTAGTLAGSEFRRVPASVTVITREDIDDSGARNLNELLEIYVPELLYLPQ